MNPDEPPYWCAFCLTKLPLGNSCENYCPGCDALIGVDGFIDEKAYNQREGADMELEAKALADGLIQ